MVEESPSGQPPAAGPRQGRLALIGLGAAVVIAAAAIGGWAIAIGGGAKKSDTGSHAGTVVTAAPSTTPIPKEVSVNQMFQSPSGNIVCSIGQFGGQPGAICVQQKIHYAVPAGACPSDEGPVFVGVDPDGGYWPCVGVFVGLNRAKPLAYDTPITQSGVTCTIALATGVTCLNKDGKGFTMEYNAGIAFV